MKIKRVGLKILRILGWVVVSIIGLLVLVALAIQIPAVQNLITQKAVTYLEDTIGTRVSLDHISLSFPKDVILEGIYLEDQQQDTLLYAGRLAVDANLFALASQTIRIDEIAINDLVANVERARDSTFNFDFIIEAFSSPEQPQDTATSAWEFALYGLDLENFKIQFYDSLEENYVDLKWDQLALSADEFNLEEQVIAVDDIDFSGVRASVVQAKMPAPEAETESAPDTVSGIPYTIGLNSINLRDIDLQYRQTALRQTIQANIGDFELEADEIDLNNQVINLSDISLSDSRFAYVQNENDSLISVNAQSDSMADDDPSQKTSEGQQQQGWRFSLADFSIENVDLRYDDQNYTAVSNGLDPNHILITNLTIAIDDIEYQPDSYQASFTEFSFEEQGGFSLKEISGNLAIQDQKARIENFSVVTGNSQLHLSLQSSYPSLQSIGERYPEATIDAQINDTYIGYDDILLLAPGLLSGVPVNLPQNGRVMLSAQMEGEVRDLQIQNFSLETLANTKLVTRGRLTNLPNMDALRYSVELDPFYTTDGDLRTLLADTLLPESIRLPEWIRLTGQFSGTLNTPDVETTLATSLGSIDLDAVANLDTTSIDHFYEAVLHVNDFQLGYLLGQDSMGILDMNAHVDGSGMSMEAMDTDFEVNVNKFEFKEYVYRDFTVDGHLQDYFFEGSASMSDPNLTFSLDGDLDYGDAEGSAPEYHFDFNLENIDLAALNLSQRPINTSFQITVDLDNADLTNLNGEVAIREFALYDGDELYKLDSLLFASVNEEGRTEFNINSDVLDATFEGTFNLISLPGVMRQFISQYFSLPDTADTKVDGPQQFTFSLDLKSSELLTEILLPDLKELNPGIIEGEFDSEQNVLDINFNITALEYGNISLNDLSFVVNANNNRLDYELTASEINAAVATIPSLELSGRLANDSLRSTLTIYDSARDERFVLGGALKSVDDFYRFHFLEDEVLLNYEDWSVPEDNYIQFGSSGFMTNNIQLSQDENRISMQAPVGNDSSMVIELASVSLQNFVSMVLPGDSTITGVIDGSVTLPGGDEGGLEATLDLTDLTLDTRRLGNLHVEMNQPTAEATTLLVTIDDADSQVRIEGQMQTVENQTTLDIDVSLDPFALAPLEPLLAGQLKSLEGMLSGDLTIRGTTTDPDIRGDLTLSQVSAVPAFTNAEVHFDQEILSFRGSTLVLQNFEILDVNDHPFSLNGSIASLTKPPFQFDLTASADNFKIFNAPKEPAGDQFIYGDVWITARADISGDSDHPVVDMSLELGDETNVTYIIPQGEAGVMERQGVVEFVDRDAAEDPFLRDIQKQESAKTDTVTAFTGITLTATIELDAEERITVVIDPLTGDQLTVRGDATLTLSIDETGNMELVGRYEIADGSYNLSFYKLVKREFDIQSGSTLIWTGDPLNAEMDITAEYQVETSPAPLLVDQVTGTSQDQLDQFKQELPFIVYLNLDEQLISPEISFELDMPESSQNALGGSVYAKIQDINSRESDLNKQVFALLILQRFVADNPFEGGGGGTLEGAARSSVSRVLTDQLNRMAQNIEGVELTFDLQSEEGYADGEQVDQTQLELGLSKSLLDDRLVVKLSGNVDIEGGQGQSTVSDYIGDLALEYKLTEDGRFRISGFYNSDYDMIDGELRETGVGLIYIKDYNSLKELFKPNAKTQD